MKIAYTTETYLIKEFTKDTPATKAVKPNDLVQFVAYKDRNDYGGNFTQLNNGVNDVPLFFIFELKEFGKFDYSDFVDSLDKDVLKIIPTNLKKFFEEYLEFDQTSYTLNTIVEAINDPMEYGELIKVTATISIKMV